MLFRFRKPDCDAVMVYYCKSPCPNFTMLRLLYELFTLLWEFSFQRASRITFVCFGSVCFFESVIELFFV